MILIINYDDCPYDHHHDDHRHLHYPHHHHHCDLILILEQLDDDSCALAVILQRDHSHDVRRIFQAWVINYYLLLIIIITTLMKLRSLEQYFFTQTPAIFLHKEALSYGQTDVEAVSQWPLQASLHMTRSQYKGKYLSGRVPENLLLCRTHEIFFLKITCECSWAELSNDV